MKLSDLEDVKIASLSDLETFFREKNIPQEKTRFFVNENRQDPKCFGIYQDVDTGNFIVYKNKSDGSRTVRYEGVDEKLAVSIFFDKLKEEMAARDSQGLYRSSIQQVKDKRKKKGNLISILVAVWAVVISFVVIFFLVKSCVSTPRVGYYNYNDNYYYYGNHAWWYYDDYYDDWEYYDGYIDGYNDYYYGKDYDNSYGYPDITDSETYESYRDSSSDDSYHYSSDDFDSYDFDSWDSGSTDWDSDW